MEKVGRGQSVVIVKKGKKKHAKDELDRLKQAEKKKRRLEKALAASAAIRSELEKKKQKRVEEQQRLDKEGAAIAESVALHVIGEDSDEPYPFMLNNHERYNPWDNSSNIGVLVGYRNIERYSAGGPGCASDAYESACRWNTYGVGPGVHVRNLQAPYYEETSPGADLSVGHIAAQAVSALQIGEDPLQEFTGAGARNTVFNRMLGSRGTRVNLYKEY